MSEISRKFLGALMEAYPELEKLVEEAFDKWHREQGKPKPKTERFSWADNPKARYLEWDVCENCNFGTKGNLSHAGPCPGCRHLQTGDRPPKPMTLSQALEEMGLRSDGNDERRFIFYRGAIELIGCVDDIRKGLAGRGIIADVAGEYAPHAGWTDKSGDYYCHCRITVTVQ